MAGSIPSVPVILARGVTRRCPWCGRGKLFHRWFTLLERCPRCGLKFEREEGAFLGSLALNFGVTSLAFIVLLVVWLALTLPQVPVVAITVASVLVAVVLPLVLYPFAKTTWAAVDIVLHWMDREDIRALVKALDAMDRAESPPDELR